MRVNLKVLRVSKNMTQAEFADNMGVGRAAYAMVEQGKRDGTMTFWNKLQQTFNIPDNEMYSLMKNEE